MADKEMTIQETFKEPQAAEEKPKAEKAPVKNTAKKIVSNESIIDQIKNMTVIELAELVKTLEKEFGVKASFQKPVIQPDPGPDKLEPEPEVKTEFNIVLKEIGSNKIAVIRVVRELTALGLKESKELVESAPAMVKENLDTKEANAAKAKLEEAGAKVELA